MSQRSLNDRSLRCRFMIPAVLGADRRTVVGGGLLVLVVALQVQPLVTAGLVLAALGAYVIVRWPYPALIAFFALVPFHFLGFELTTSKFGLSVGPLTNWKEAFLLGLLARGLQMRIAARDARDVLWTPQNQLLVGYMLVLLLWVPMSPFTNAAVTSFIRTAEGPLMLITVIALRPPRRVIIGCIVAVLAGAVVLAPAAVIEQRYPSSFQDWYGFHTLSETFWAHPFERTGYRSGSFFGDSLVLGFWLAGTTSLAAGAFLYARRWRRAAAGLVVVACVAATVTTYTRSAYVAMPLGVVLTLALAIDHTKVRYATLAIAATGVIVVMGGLYFSGSGRLEHGDSSENHFDLLSGAFSQSTEHPLGFGLGTTDFVAHRYNIQWYVGQSVDSVFGDRLVEGGPLIMGLYVVSLASVTVRLHRARSQAIRAGDRMAVVLSASALGAFVGVAAAGVFLPVQEQPVSLTAWGGAGLALAAVMLSGRPGDGQAVHTPAQSLNIA